MTTYNKIEGLAGADGVGRLLMTVLVTKNVDLLVAVIVVVFSSSLEISLLVCAHHLPSWVYSRWS